MLGCSFQVSHSAEPRQVFAERCDFTDDEEPGRAVFDGTRRDREYVERASLGLDLKVMAQTLYCILFKSWPFVRRRAAARATARSQAQLQPGDAASG